MLSLRTSLVGLMFGVMALAAHAHGPTPQKVDESIDIAAPPDKVWAIAKDFGKISDWNPTIAKSEGTGGNVAGGTRVVTLKSGGELQDGLDEVNDKDMSYSYRLAKENIAVFPVSFYSAELSVKPGDGGGSKVRWVGRFYRADTSNFPPGDKNDAAAIAAMKNLITEGLKGLKAKAEAK